MNTYKYNNTSYKLESIWNHSNIDANFELQRDSNGQLYKDPVANINKWGGQDQFASRLSVVQEYIYKQNKYSKYDLKKDKDKECLICKKKDISTGIYNLNNNIWEDGLLHYINDHNIKPSDEFIELIYTYKLKTNKTKIMRFKSELFTIADLKYIKVDKNQIMIMDALLKHGGYSKKYLDFKDKNIFRYSEHAGLLDLNDNGLDKVLVSGKTTRVDKNDNEIYMPKNMTNILEYEYIFHTHPATKIAGGRVAVGILYEVPSISDIFHFIDHFNRGLTQGSLVIAEEGLYNIRKYEFDRKKIKIDEDDMYKNTRRVFNKIQDQAIEKYGTKFTASTFYSKIAQDREFIDVINKTLNKYKLQIDYYPRIKDKKGRWIIDDVYLPVYMTEIKK
jgi:hypothetical protein